MFAKNELKAWLQASRLPSQLYIILPLVLGQLLAFSSSGFSFFSYNAFFMSLVYSFSLQFFIVYANDLADYETDKMNQNSSPFSGGSRVLVDKLLKPKDLEFALCLCLAMVISLGFFFSYYRSSLTLLFLSLAGPFFLWLYSFPPVKLSYRGGGEILQAVGLSCILPLLGFLLQKGQLDLYFFLFFFSCFFTQLACAMSTTIPDVTSDHFSHKKTFVLLLGPYWTCFFICFFHNLSYFFVFYFLLKNSSFEFKKIVEPFFIQVLLNFFLLYSFYKKKINSFIFFSLSLTFFLLLYLMYLTSTQIF